MGKKFETGCSYYLSTLGQVLLILDYPKGIAKATDRTIELEDGMVWEHH